MVFRSERQRLFLIIDSASWTLWLNYSNKRKQQKGNIFILSTLFPTCRQRIQKQAVNWPNNTIREHGSRAFSFSSMFSALKEACVESTVIGSHFGERSSLSGTKTVHQNIVAITSILINVQLFHCFSSSFFLINSSFLFVVHVEESSIRGCSGVVYPVQLLYWPSVHANRPIARIRFHVVRIDKQNVLGAI